LRAPGSVGWWAVSGDLPTDYLSAFTVRSPRAAIAAFAIRWADAASQMSRGAMPSGMSLGKPSEWPQLAPLLQSRAALLSDWAANATLWESDAA
jgi:hypothetical protein